MANHTPPLNMQSFTIGIVHDVGMVRQNNEDASWVPPQTMDAQLLEERGYLFIVADGMGGYESGDVASVIAVQQASQSYYGQHDPESNSFSEWLRLAVQQAQQAIADHQAQHEADAQMGSTLVMAVIRGDELIVGNLGDSRCYRMRDGALQQLSRDHSWVADQVRNGLLTPDEAEKNPHRNILTRGLGQTTSFAQPDVDMHDWRAGDRLLLCSDGLWDAVPFERLAELVRLADPQAAAQALIDAANANGAADNVTALVVVSANADAGQPVAAPLPAQTEYPTQEVPQVVPALPPIKRTPKLLVASVAVVAVVVLLALVVIVAQALMQPRVVAITRPTESPMPTMAAAAPVAATAISSTATPQTQSSTVTPLGEKPNAEIVATQTLSEAIAASTPVAAEPSATAPVATVTALPMLAAGQCVTHAVSLDEWQWSSRLVKTEADAIAIVGTNAPIETKAPLVQLLGLPELRAPFTIQVVARAKVWSSTRQLWACFPQNSAVSTTNCAGMQRVTVQNAVLDSQTNTRTFIFTFTETPSYPQLRLVTNSAYYIYVMGISYCAG